MHDLRIIQTCMFFIEIIFDIKERKKIRVDMQRPALRAGITANYGETVITMKTVCFSTVITGSANLSCNYRNFIHSMTLMNVVILYNNQLIIKSFYIFLSLLLKFNNVVNHIVLLNGCKKI